MILSLMNSIEVIRPDIKIVQTVDPSIAVPWIKEQAEIENPVRNTGHQYLKFINSTIFSEEARHFLRAGYYTSAPYGSRDYNEYWDEQESRVLNGYSVGGVRIPGRYYYFLNFCQMKARPIDPVTGLERKSRKIITFPRFLDHQYYFFLELEECFAEGPHTHKPMQGLCVFKSRRKGFTYVIAGGVYNYNVNFVPASMNVLAAYQKDFFKVTLDGIHFTLNHTNKSTDWAKRRDRLDQRDHFRVSFVTKNELGMDVEDGYMSEVHAISFKDDPFKSIGESSFVVGFEEAGQFPGMLSALTIAEPTYRDGDIMTGIPIIWGSAGNTNAVTDLEEVFYNGDAYGLKTYSNIYDENATGDCGFFIDDLWYYPGRETAEGTEYMVDNQGNSLRQAADRSIDQKRERKKKGSRNSYNLFITQQPKRPSEGFLRSVGTIFDTIATKSRVAELVTNPVRYDRTVLRVRMELSETGHISWVTNLSDQPLHDFPLKDNKNKPGVIEIYEVPIRDSNGNIPSLRYIAGIDSYDDDASDTVSVGSMHILDRFTDRIVASYKARPDTKTWYEQCRRLLMYYGATANYERRNKGIYGHFFNKNSLYLLCDEPEILSEKGISKANKIGNNSKGTYPSLPVKNYGNSLMVAWLDLPAYGEEEDSGITNLMKVRTISLLREMIHWTDDERKNFDDVDALRMLMIYRESLIRFEVQKQVAASNLANDPFWDRMKKGAKNTNPRHIGSSDFLQKKAIRRTFSS
jgi:hypothetical protein